MIQSRCQARGYTCPELVVKGTIYCITHAREQANKYMRRRNMIKYDRNWSKLRFSHLSKYPFCVDCARHGQSMVAQEVDHIIPHRGDWRLFGDPNNLQSLCKPCHSRKTRLETYGGRV